MTNYFLGISSRVGTLWRYSELFSPVFAIKSSYVTSNLLFILQLWQDEVKKGGINTRTELHYSRQFVEASVKCSKFVLGAAVSGKFLSDHTVIMYR